MIPVSGATKTIETPCALEVICGIAGYARYGNESGRSIAFYCTRGKMIAKYTRSLLLQADLTAIP